MIKAKQYGDTQFITGIRGWAAMLVLVGHTASWSLQLAPAPTWFSWDGTGVMIFYVISGFSIQAAWEGSRSFGEFFRKRLARIVPLYYFWLLVFATWALANRVDKETLYSLAMHAAFLHTWDWHTATSLFLVEWSLSVELFWYAMVPLLARYAGPGLTAAGAAWYLLGNHVMPLLAHQLLRTDVYVPPVAFAYNPLTYLLPFALGAWAWKLRKTMTAEQKAMGMRVFWWSFIAYVVLSYLAQRFVLSTMVVGFWIGFALATWGSARDPVTRTLFCGPVSQWLGTVSYSIYLVHIPLLRFLEFWTDWTPGQLAVAVIALTLLAAPLTYRWIELPFQRSPRLLGLPVRRGHKEALGLV